MVAMTPRVSIVMATYNRSAVLPFSIGSVLLQGFTDFELLVVGDGCTDDSAEVVAAFGDPRIRWIGLPTNSGHQSTPNNAGIEAARGEIIAYLGHDDLWLPGHLAALVAAIDAGADFAYAAIYKPAPSGGYMSVSYNSDYAPGDSVPPSSVAHRRSNIERSGGWPHFSKSLRWPEIHLWQSMYEAGGHFAAVPQLSVIKISAGDRRNVYRERPSHEQAYWFDRIRSEPDLLRQLPLEILSQVAAPPQLRYTTLIRQFVDESWNRVVRRINGTYKWPDKPGLAVQRLRKYKGLGPAPLEKAETGGEA